MAVDRSEIVFFDLETIPLRGGQKWTIIEFGAILLCPQKLEEIGKFRTLIRPDNLSLISETSVKRNGITRGEVASARKFEEVAERIYQILHNRSWAGHNILMADCKWICEAFKDIGRDAPEPKRCFDTYKSLDQKFRSRAGDMKMATLANYFGLGINNTVNGNMFILSLADVRMNIEILKSCATVLFLESSSPNVLPAPNLATPAISSSNINPRKRKAFTETDSEENPEIFVEPHEISTFSREILEDQNLVILKDPSTFSLKIVSSQWATRKMTLFHEDLPFPMHYSNMKIRYGISKKYYHPTGKQRLSFVVEPSAETCNILKIYDVLVHILFKGHNDMSKWKPLVKDDQSAIPNIRIHIETSGFGNTATYSTELYVTDSHGTSQRFAPMAVDIDELDELFVSGKSVDAEFNFEIYDFEQKAGIRLVARRLTVCGDG